MLVPDEVRKCVFFLCFNNGRGFPPAGTGFFVSRPMDEVEGTHFIYAITAKHVIDFIREQAVDGSVYLRLNFLDGTAKRVQSDPNDWVPHPTDASVDAAALAFAPPSDIVDYLHVPVAMAATSEVIEKEAIGAGDEVALAGLFTNHYGLERNLPIIRIGNIALMPEEPVHTQDLGPMDAYLVESRSIGGLSGSPVFVNTGGVRTLDGSNYTRGSVFHWLGLMHGHWDVSLLDIDNVVEDALTRRNVNMGIGIVVPATRVLEVLDHPRLVEARRVATPDPLRDRHPTPSESGGEDQRSETEPETSPV